MTSAKELLIAYLQNIHDADTAIALFSDDAAIELPYLSSLGLPWRRSGRETLYHFLQNLPKTFPGFKFQNIQIHIDTPEQAFGEYEVECTVAATGRPYHQHYMGRLVAKEGKIVLLREALDLVQVARSSFPNGVADLK
jgi:ketosteroid isomerase-like protein